jgi:hypothetical protein
MITFEINHLVDSSCESVLKQALFEMEKCQQLLSLICCSLTLLSGGILLDEGFVPVKCLVGSLDDIAKAVIGFELGYPITEFDSYFLVYYTVFFL